MTDNADAYLARKHFAGLDGLRAAAIIGVVWHHSPRPDFLAMFGRGFLGVDLFFILSGFLIATLLLREKERNGRISLRNFWARRFLRLMPAYYLLLFGMLGAYLIFKPGDPNTTRLTDGFAIYAFYLSNWFHPQANNLGITWSLATEEQFYLIWPLIAAFAAPRFAIMFWAGAVLINQLLNFGALDPLINQLFGHGAAEGKEILETTFTPILLGIGLAHLLHDPKWFARVSRIASFRFAPYVYFTLLLLLINYPTDDISGALRLNIHLVMTVFLAAIIMQPASSMTRILSLRPIVLIGTVSYGMYLYHLWCIHVVRTVFEKFPLPQLGLQFPIALAATIATAALSYYFYERWFLDMRKRFQK